MIIGSDTEQKVGQVVRANYYTNGELQAEKQPFVIVREVTLEEYTAKKGLRPGADVMEQRASSMGLHASPTPLRVWFYEVSTD